MIGGREATTRDHHEEWARVVAATTRHFGGPDIAEEAGPRRSSPGAPESDAPSRCYEPFRR